MGLSAGIIGLPNVGKSTIFNAVCATEVAAENYPFCTVDPNNGMVAVPDPRLNRISEIIKTRKIVPTFVELVDIAGLVRGASKGEGLGNQFLGHVRTVDALIHVVRCFTDENVVHVGGMVDPIEDVTVIDTELLLKDLETVERALDRMQKMAKSGEKEAKQKAALLEEIRSRLSEGAPVRSISLSEDDSARIKEFSLLTAKPIQFVANVDEDAILEDNAYVTALREYADTHGARCLRLCGKMEAEIAQLPDEDRGEFLEGLGLTEPGLHSLVRSTYELLGLQTFYTAGEKENRAWTVRKGISAAKAAGVIHSDIERGFISAEVYTIGDLEHYGSEAALKAAGKIRREGREYILGEGDILHFHFNV